MFRLVYRSGAFVSANNLAAQRIYVCMHTTIRPDSPPIPSLNAPVLTPEAFTALLNRIADAAPETDWEGAFPEAAFDWLAEAGLLGITLPGHELDFNRSRTTARLLHVLKRIGAANLAVGRVYEGHINALYLIHRYASPAQREHWYVDVRDYHRLFSVWNTQGADGVRMHPTGAGTYTLEGSKTFCSGAGWVDRPLVTGQVVGGDRSGWQMGIVPTERVSPIGQDAAFWQPLGMRASASFKLDFTGVELNEADLLGPPNAYLQQPYFSGGAIRFAAVQLGGAEALYEATRQFLTRAGRTDDTQQRIRLAEMACLIESGNQWISAAGTKTEQWLAAGADWPVIVGYANMTRVAIEEICLRIMPLAERCVGAQGLLRPHVFERIHRDLTLYLRQPAPDATLVDIGRYVLTHPDSAHDLWQ